MLEACGFSDFRVRFGGYYNYYIHNTPCSL